MENPSGRLTVPPELCEENGCSVVATQLSESQQIVVLSAPADLLARMEELLPSWLEIPQAQYAAGISKTHSLRSLSRCMLEATDAFQLSSAGNAQILSYGDMPDAFTAMEFPPEKELQLIASCLLYTSVGRDAPHVVHRRQGAQVALREARLQRGALHGDRDLARAQFGELDVYKRQPYPPRA